MPGRKAECGGCHHKHRTSLGRGSPSGRSGRKQGRTNGWECMVRGCHCVKFIPK